LLSPLLKSIAVSQKLPPICPPAVPNRCHH